MSISKLIILLDSISILGTLVLGALICQYYDFSWTL
jgi:hypothetical protein